MYARQRQIGAGASPFKPRGRQRWTPRGAARHNEPMGERSDLPHGSLELDPVIEAYKRDVDRTLIRENLRLTTDERLKKMIAVLRFVEEVRQSRGTTR